MGQLLTLIDGIISKKPFREQEFSPINMKISWDIILLTIKLSRTINHFTQTHTQTNMLRTDTHLTKRKKIGSSIRQKCWYKESLIKLKAIYLSLNVRVPLTCTHIYTHTHTHTKHTRIHIVVYNTHEHSQYSGKLW